MSGTAPGDFAPSRGQAPHGGAPLTLAERALGRRSPRGPGGRSGTAWSRCRSGSPASRSSALVLGPSLLVAGSVVGTAVGLLGVVLALRIARRLGGLYRRVAARLLDEQISGPPPFRRPAGSIIVRLDARLRDGAGWRADRLRPAEAATRVRAVPRAGVVGVRPRRPDLPAVVAAVPQRTRPGPPAPVPAVTPPPFGSFVHASNWGGTLLVAIFGAALLLIAPWLTRGVVTADRWLARSLLGPGTLTQRVRDLEQARARVVDDSVALLRQVERDLHDGAQVRLAAMAMNLGMAKEKLGADGRHRTCSGSGNSSTPPTWAPRRPWSSCANWSAASTRPCWRSAWPRRWPPSRRAAPSRSGSPPASRPGRRRPSRRSPTSARPNCWPTRPSTAARTRSAYLRRSPIPNGTPVLRVAVCDDGRGGADPAGGSGLAGLERRVGTVDGRLTVDSPPGGPTRITVELPMRA